MTIYDTREGTRLVLNQQKRGHWNRLGPSLLERAWGTGREDYTLTEKRGVTSHMIMAEHGHIVE